MAKERKPETETKSPAVDNSQERLTYETILSQRIHFIIIFFVIVLASTFLVADISKEYLLSILSIGTIISWALAFSVLRLSLKLRSLVSNGGTITKPIKWILRLPRIILGWAGDLFIPVFCSLIITASLIFASAGYFDTKILPTKVEEKIKEITPPIKKKSTDSTKKKSEYIKEFQNLDSLLKK